MSTEYVPDVCPDPLFLITTVSTLPRTAAFFIDAVLPSPQFEGSGIYFSVVNLTISAGEIV